MKHNLDDIYRVLKEISISLYVIFGGIVAILCYLAR